ncbi:hypothetical protein HD806DRAFT_278875 [Xylariaceae sp. AK1471]|nr:hypothetical protein HD806DRAFT_278875 [Xylariaceae sp. AK1471]
MAATVDAKLLRATKFPIEFNQKVDMQKVNLQVMKKWIASRISEILGSEDDVVIELCFNLIDGPRFPDIKSMQIQLTGFLDKDTAPFCKELWKLCLSAQSSPQGVPKELLEAKKLELIQEKIDADKAAEEARIRRETQERRDRELGEVRDRERRDRGFRGGRGDNWRGGRRGGDRAFDDRSRGFGRGTGRGGSPPGRDRNSFQGNRDRYVPEGRRGGRQDLRRGRSPTRSVSTSSRGPSRSRSSSNTSNRNRRDNMRSLSPPRHRAGNRSPPRYRKRERSTGRNRNPRGRGSRSRKNSSSPGSYSDSESSSRSRSPAPKRRRFSDSPSRSRSPTRRDSRRLSRSRSLSSSRSRSRSSRRRLVREPAGRSPPPNRRGRELISRSPSPNRRGRLRRSFTRSLSRSESPENSKRSRRRSSSRGRGRGRDASASPDRPGSSKHWRHSSGSPRSHNNRLADVLEDEDKPRSPRHDTASAAEETKTPQQRASELKEKLLKDKIIKMRKTSNGDAANR